MTVSREMATAFVEGYGRTWGSWDFDGFVDLFKDDVVYVEHPVNETVVGREAMGRYIRREQAEAGTVRVRMGKPIVDGDRVAAEFWTAMSNRDGESEETLAGCFIARLDATDGRCTHFRQYFSEFEGYPSPFEGWGE
jgi:ketosteroid isomerase-like protein